MLARLNCFSKFSNLTRSLTYSNSITSFKTQNKTIIAKMNPLKLNQSFLTLIGLCAPDEKTSMPKRIRNISIYAVTFVMHIINSIATSLYFIRYISIDYDGAIYGLLAATVLICLIYILVNLRYHYDKLLSVFSTLDAIYRKCKIIQRNLPYRIIYC